jgi:hypothetical protein
MRCCYSAPPRAFAITSRKHANHNQSHTHKKTTRSYARVGCERCGRSFEPAASGDYLDLTLTSGAPARAFQRSIPAATELFRCGGGGGGRAGGRRGALALPFIACSRQGEKTTPTHPHKTQPPSSTLTLDRARRQPLISFVYERGWRQGFAAAGFPGPEKEYEIAMRYLQPSYGGTLVRG